MAKKKITTILKKLPHSPGVYLMKGEDEKIIYIGKAKDLAKRVKQYFRPNYEHSSRTKKLIEKAEDLEFIEVDTELEATILEHTLIKDHQPKYNVIMKDGKNYSYIKITKEDFPRIQIVRTVKKDNATYIGPKTAGHKVQETFKVLKKIFPFRHCGLNIACTDDAKKVEVTNKVIKYPCLDHYIKRCAAPCIGNISKEDYAKIVEGVVNFLKGNGEGVISSLENKMNEYANAKNFEKAAKERDKIEKVRSILEKQKISDPNQSDKDVINYCILRENAYFNLFQIRGGKLIGQENFILAARDSEDKTEDKEVLESFLHQYYNIATDIPPEALIPHEVEEPPKEIKLVIPQKGVKIKLLEMSLKNALIYADRNKPSWQEESELTIKATEDLQKTLGLKEFPKRMECYDISHLSGTDTVGSMIVFEKGVPKKDHYRKFKLRTVDNKPDDYKSMEEVLTRRLQKIAQQVHFKDYLFKKARKKDWAFITKHTGKMQDKTGINFFVLEKDKKVFGCVGIYEHSAKVSELRKLFILPKFRGSTRGYKLLSEAIKKAKSKRVYGLCNQSLRDYYALFGFEEIKKIPDELQVHHKICEKTHKDTPVAIAFDKMKHKDDASFTSIPDLILIDGGKGQLSAGTKVLTALDLNIPVISLAKQFEEIFVPWKKDPIILDRTTEALKLLQRMRDEAHRFAIDYNKNLRTKRFRNK